MRKLTAVICLAGALLAAPAHAAPSLLNGGPTSPNTLGATGLLLTPSAYTVGDRGISGGIFSENDFTSYSVLYGVTKRLEVGGTYLDTRHHFGDNGFLANAKYNVL